MNGMISSKGSQPDHMTSMAESIFPKPSSIYGDKGVSSAFGALLESFSVSEYIVQLLTRIFLSGGQLPANVNSHWGKAAEVRNMPRWGWAETGSNMPRLPL
jgi:hypothetical protein